MNSWIDLEQRFRNLVSAMQFVRLDAQWGAAGEHWRLAGGFTPASHEYEILCMLAGQLLQRVLRESVESEKSLLDISDPKVRWYTLLKTKSPFFGDHSYGEQLHEDGSSAGFIFTGSLSRPAEAAAMLCLSLQASHPIIEQNSKWQWLHKDYVKAIIIGTVLAFIGAVIKLLLGS